MATSSSLTEFSLLLAAATVGFTVADVGNEDPDDDFVVGEPMDDDVEEVNPPVAVTHTTKYIKPSTDGLVFASTFESDWEGQWAVSSAEKFTGKWERTVRHEESVVGDYGMRVMDKAHHHAIAAKFPKTIKSLADNELIVSYEAKFENGLNCGGSYLKLVDSGGKDLKDFSNETPYVVMFGPDRCGSTNKVHLIIKDRNPISGKWTEHHLSAAPAVPHGKDTHLYTLRILTNNTYEILVDNVVKKSGKLHEDFSPGFVPDAEINDPEDLKPADWVDEATMADPKDTKPEDWDEEAPRKIRDTETVVPEGWLEEEPLKIENPDAEVPDEWDEEEDGEWTAPMIANPACEVGCGPWEPPMIDNPQYKGKWSPKRIPNPAYKGPWEPRKIPNPEFFENENPHELSGAKIDGIGFELWTMDDGLLFDNVVVGHDWPAAQRFIQDTFVVRSSLEAKNAAPSAKASLPASYPEGVMGQVYGLAMEKPVVAAVTALVSLLTLFWATFRLSGMFKKSAKPQVASAATDGKKSEKGEKDTKKGEKDTKKGEKEAKKDEKEAKKDEKEAKKDEKEAKKDDKDAKEEDEKDPKSDAAPESVEEKDTPTSTKTRKRGGRPAAAD